MHKYLLAIALLLCLTGCSTVRSAKLFAPSWFGFSEINKGVYVDDQMPSNQRQEFLKTLSLAKERVSVFFGGIEESAEVFACSTEECFVSHGGVVPQKGKAYGKSMLLLSPTGLDAVITSHELTHIELHGRVGAFRSWYAIPPWFDEGLAVLVSEDPRYTEEAWLKATENGRNVPELKAIGKSTPLGGNWLLGYGTSRRAVGEWYARVGHTGLTHLIAEMKGGKDFDSTFTSLSSAAK